MDLLDAIILGLVEGLTEYLPVSSTGHLILTASLLGLDRDAALKEAVDTFNIVVQGGAILAVLGLYRARVRQMLRGLVGLDPAGFRLAVLLFVAFLPAAVLGPFLSGTIERRLFFPVPVLSALALGGVWMILLGRGKERVSSDVSADALVSLPYKKALLIGCFQVIAMWPGTSRSMMTIAGGSLLGLRPKQAAEFSFLLGLPTLSGACVWSLYGDYTDAVAAGTPTMFERLGAVPVLVGLFAATLSAALAVRWLVGFLHKHGLGPFGWYRIALAACLGVLLAAGALRIGPASASDFLEEGASPGGSSGAGTVVPGVVISAPR